MEDSEVEVSTEVALEVEVSMGEVSAVASTVVALEVEVSMGEVSAVALVVAVWLPDTLEAESAAAAAESALADRTSQVAFQTLLAQDPGSPPLGDHHPGNLSMMDDLIEQ